MSVKDRCQLKPFVPFFVVFGAFVVRKAVAFGLIIDDCRGGLRANAAGES
jgi:hypothetical protein